MTQHQDRKDGDCRAYRCNLRVVVCVRVLVDVVCVMLVVLIAHVDVVHAVIHSSRSHVCSDFL